MLRSAVVVIGAVFLVAGLSAAFVLRTPSSWPLIVLGALLLLGTLAERVVYKPLAKEKPPGAVRTNERFIDDKTGKSVTVYTDPATGERTYVEE